MNGDRPTVFPGLAQGNTSLTASYLENDSRLQSMLALTGYCFWEQDEQFRFKNITDAHEGKESQDFKDFLGKAVWDVGGTPVNEAGWEEHQSCLEERKPFKKLLIWLLESNSGEKYLECKGEPVFDDEGRFQGYQGIIKDVTFEYRKERLFNVGNDVSRILLQNLDTDKAVRDAIKLLCKSEGWDSGRYWHFNSLTQTFEDFGGWHAENEVNNRIMKQISGLKIPLGQGLIGEVGKTGEIHWVEDLANDPRLRLKHLVEGSNWNNGLIFPVRYYGKIIGVLFFVSGYIEEPDEQLCQLIHSLGDHIGNMFHQTMAVRKLQESEERYASTVNLAAIGISHVDSEGYLIDFNQQFNTMLGYMREELLGKNIREISHPDDVHTTDDLREKLLEGKLDFIKAEKRYLRKDGSPIWVSLSIAPKRNEKGRHLYDISVVEDISARKTAEERVQYLANHDEMTGLPNRVLFGQLLNVGVSNCNRYQKKMAVLFVDLDRFKQINDSMGHDAGDELIKKMSGRFKRCVRASDVVARLGGDEFVILLQGIREKDQIKAVAENVLKQAAKPIEIRDNECRVSASVGIAVYPDHAKDEKELMKNADMAMYKAKEKGKNSFEFFTNTLQADIIEQINIESCLRGALDKNELELAYQPKVDTRTCKIIGVEALLRWNSPELGPVSPVRFIPIAEEIGVIMNLGKWVLQKACWQNIKWMKEGKKPTPIAVNLSAKQFSDPDLIPYISDLLRNTGLDPSLLELEITETMVMDNVEESKKYLMQLKKLGLKISVDDFGTGYSSLAHLKRFPIHTIKIDRSFIMDMHNNPEDQAITKAIITMGKTLGLNILAEGVENREQHEMLIQDGCDQIQGYYFSKPVFCEELEPIIEKEYIKKTRDEKIIEPVKPVRPASF